MELSVLIFIFAVVSIQIIIRMSNKKHKDILVRYLYDTVEIGVSNFEDLNDNQQPYTMEELNARIDEAEEEIERGEGKSFDEMMAGFKKELLWLK